MTARAPLRDRTRHGWQAPGVTTCWAMSVTIALDHAVRRGLEARPLLDAVGLAASDLTQPEALVSLEALYDLIERAADALDDPDFGLRMGLALGDGSLGALGFVGMTSPTLGAGLEAMLSTWRAAALGERYALERRGDTAVFRYHPFGAARPAHHHLAAFFLADLCVNVPPHVEGGVDDLAASIRADASRAARLADALSVPVSPGAPVDELRFAVVSLDRPMRRADPALRTFFEGYLADHASAPAATTADRVRLLVDRRLPDGPLDRASVAEALRVSVRTLQRQLRREGASLSRLVRERRLLRARALLDEGKSMSEAAFEAGYSEASALHRALKRE